MTTLALAASTARRKTALITGASAGLGVEFALQLAAKNMDLVLVARRESRLQSLAARLRQQHNDIQVLCIAADLSAPEAPQHIYAKVRQANIEIDYLINNAGASGPEMLKEPRWKVQEEYLRLMMTSVTELCHLFVPTMQKRSFGRVINVASVAGRIARGGDCHYGPSKAYLVAFSEALALTVSRDGVLVSALCPGFTHTEFHEAGGRLALKEATPGFIWYSAETVVREGLKGLEAGKRIVISGRLYRWLDPILQSVWLRPLALLTQRSART